MNRRTAIRHHSTPTNFVTRAGVFVAVAIAIAATSLGAETAAAAAERDDSPASMGAKAHAADVDVAAESDTTSLAAAPEAGGPVCFPYPLTVCCDAAGCWLY